MEQATTWAPRRAAEPATHAEEPAATWRRSLLHHSPALLLLAIVIADAFQAADPDLWGHLRFGQLLLTGHPGRLDPFNYSAPGHTWLHYTWLFEVVVAWLYAHLGVIGLKLLKFACTAALVSFVALALAETGAESMVQLAVLLLTSIALTLGMQFRPQMFDFAFVSAIVWLLARDNYRHVAPLWVTIPMFVLWSNLHPGFFVGLAALGIYGVASALADVRAGRGIGRGIRLGVIVMLGAAATLANPLALESWKSIIVTLRDPLIPQVMGDCRPILTRLATSHFPSVISLYCGYALFLMCALAILLVIVPAAGDLPMIAVAALMSAAALDATRNVSFAAIAIAPVLARRLGILASRGARAAELSAQRGWNREVVPALLAIALMVMSGLFSPRLRDALPPPAGALAFMDAHRLSGNILNEFVWGEYLIWHCAPRCHVFIDGRFDLVYPIPVIVDYVHFADGDDAAAHVLASYPHDFVLIETESRACQFMTGQPGWKLIYRDENAALFARAGSQASNIAPTPVIGHPGASYFP